MLVYKNRRQMSELLGKTFSRVTKSDDSINFHTEDGTHYCLMHDQDCCEYVRVEDVTGDLEDLIGTPILKSEMRTNSDDGALNPYDHSYTWTFFEFATIKGDVTIRFYGTSNGYYSEDADLYLMKGK